MLSGNAAMMQASCFDGLVFDPFTFEEEGLAASKIKLGWGEIGDAFMAAQMIVVADEVSDLLFKVTRQIIVFVLCELIWNKPRLSGAEYLGRKAACLGATMNGR